MTINHGSRQRSAAAVCALASLVLLLSGCHVSGAHSRSATPSFGLLSTDHFDEIDSRRDRTALSFSFSPLSSAATDLAFADNRVRPRVTRWGAPWDREELTRNLDAILVENGIAQEEQRVRMIAHAIVASGWRQNIWNHNLWGVRKGSWDGPFFVMSTTEEEADGSLRLVYDAAWRSFSSWKEAVDDYRGRIRPDSRRPSYRQAYKHLVDEDRRADGRYWEALGDGNYYTASHFSKKSFAMLCWAVRGYLEDDPAHRRRATDPTPASKK